ncbi:hypothetical protein HZS_5869 [Henneguya salminicola]|nr:hypothetical protein HZS_5869 [Henneguya salminicola]
MLRELYSLHQEISSGSKNKFWVSNVSFLACEQSSFALKINSFQLPRATEFLERKGKVRNKWDPKISHSISYVGITNYSCCIELCCEALAQYSLMVGGSALTVETDEVEFGKRKYNCGILEDGII